MEVLVEQRFALGAVGDHRVRLAGQFDVGGKAAAAGADHAGLLDLFHQIHGDPQSSVGRDDAIAK